MISIDSLLKMITNASDQCLMMSRRNCHGEGLHSIVLSSNNGKLTRFFITDKNHSMHRNIGNNFDINLGVHNHRYAIRLTGVTGDAININYVEDKSACNVAKYKFTSKIDGGIGAEYLGISGLKLHSLDIIDDIFIPQKGLHTVYIPKGVVSCWIVSEGDEVSKTVNLFQNGSAKSSSYDLFDSAKSARDFCFGLISQIEL